MIGPTEVVIARPGYFDQRVVQISPPSMSWRTDGPGSFDCEIELRSLHEAGLMLTGTDNPLKGRWLWYNHPTAGPWGGVITRTNVGDWFCRVTAEQFNVLLRKRRVRGEYAAVAISPGSLALTFLTGAERNGDAFMLTGWTADESGQVVDIEPRSGDLCDDVIPMLANFGYQWRVRAETMDERLFEFRTRLGTDKRATVQLSEGRHLVRPDITGDLWSVANSIEGVPGDAGWRDARGYQLDDEASIRALGRRYEVTIPYGGAVTRSTIIPNVKRDLARLKYPQEIARFDVVDADMCWQWFREGDVVTIASAHANLVAPMDVDIRSLDVRSGVMAIAGRVLIEAAA